MDDVSLTPPVLTVHQDYLLPVKAKDFGVCGEANFAAGCYEGCTFVDSTGIEWSILQVRSLGHKNWAHRLLPQVYREIRVSFELSRGGQYSLEELKSLVSEFLLSKKLKGSPFPNKTIDVPTYLDRFDAIEQLISELGYFDARR